MKYIKRKEMNALPTSGMVSDTINVEDKVKNAPSINLVQHMTGIPVDGVIDFDGTEEEIPEGYEIAEEQITNSWEEIETGTKAPSLALLKTAFKRTETAITIPVLSAGASGYLTATANIPDGYLGLVSEVATGQISTSNGLQLTVVEGVTLASGASTIYVNYYAPKNITATFAVAIHIICIKSQMLLG